ncbi:MAG: LutB/LldF family L-lactate oxidation iron-sulfur protein [Desulfocapsaceae bacterium]|jgi:L-lactate dehydrogenase complex protein LldF|nr:LutB/LldF family L-lactate oxidation iron-sulfur protein [Desulfocapsaceae bacterium]
MKAPDAPDYRQGARLGLASKSLQKNLKTLQNRFGRGAFKEWSAPADPGQRERVKQRRMDILEHLDAVLALLADRVEENGGRVFFAKTAEEAVKYCVEVARQGDVKTIVKGKSMVSAEIGVDAALHREGIEVLETDLGEYIVQLREEAPSHIVAPSVHLNRRQVGRLFTEKLGIPYSEDPPTLTMAARKALRTKMLTADMGISGCNIACAETGRIGLVSNEGNIRMSTTMPRIHVALMGIERVEATLAGQLETLQLLIKAATQQKLSGYVSFTGGPRQSGDIDGPEEFHLVLIDNGRSKILADPEFREVLACLRCGACLNVCPVYGRIGGHAYNATYSGPVGAVLTPLLYGVNRHADLCKGESLCGACLDVCPVNNDLPRMLLALRYKLAYGDERWQTRPHKPFEAFTFKLWRLAVSNALIYRLLCKGLSILQQPFIKENGMITRGIGPAGEWTRDRDLPPLARRPFSKRWRQRKEGKSAQRRDEVKHG